MTRKSTVGLRNLCRALKMMRNAISLKYPVLKAIYDGLMTCFTSHLESKFAVKISQAIKEQFQIKKLEAPKTHGDGVVVGDFVLKKGTDQVQMDEKDFILTNSFKNLTNRLASIIAVSDFAVILEGPTSAGKTSTV